jgi:hypothetical protein
MSVLSDNWASWLTGCHLCHIAIAYLTGWHLLVQPAQWLFAHDCRNHPECWNLQQLEVQGPLDSGPQLSLAMALAACILKHVVLLLSDGVFLLLCGASGSSSAMIGADMVVGRMADGGPQASGLRLACQVSECAGVNLCCILGLVLPLAALAASHREPTCYQGQVVYVCAGAAV